MSQPVSSDTRSRADRFTELYHQNHDDLTAYCLRRVGAEAASDAVAEIFLVAWRRFDELPPGTEARLWLFGVARNIVANQTRSRARRSRLHLKLVDDRDDSAPPNDLVVDALHRLDDDDAELLRLLTWERLTHAEAAVVLDCSPNAVTIRAHRARARLTEIYEQLRREPDPGNPDAPNPPENQG